MNIYEKAKKNLIDKIKNSNWITKFLAVFLPILVILYWQYGSTAGIINTSILPPPSKVAARFAATLSSGSLQKNIIASCRRVFEGFFIGATLGLSLGILIGLYKSLGEILNGFIGVLRPIPAMACTPIFIMWLGIGEASKIAVIVFGTFWPVLLNTVDGMKSTDKKLLELASVLEKNKKSVLLEIVLPSAIPSIFTGLKLGISRAWGCVVVAEMIAASVGVGYLIEYARNLSKPDLMLVGVAVIGIIGLLIDWLMTILQRKILYWDNIK